MWHKRRLDGKAAEGPRIKCLATIPINGKAAETDGSSGPIITPRCIASIAAITPTTIMIGRRQAEGDGAEGSMPFDAASGDKGDLHDEYQHPKGEDRAMDMKDGAGKRRAHYAGLEVSWREADGACEQCRHALAVEAAFRGRLTLRRSVGLMPA